MAMSEEEEGDDDDDDIFLPRSSWWKKTFSFGNVFFFLRNLIRDSRRVVSHRPSVDGERHG